ncbi:Mis12-domain-containing protein [Metschnikowia bicuspidata var. bicuspidata NRRL YB-4993]|uniref:Mis12-domain-containing protein n=1 Tax=Metschnikowia bicuspidata var. bicuspidata NRRL YB-4993 TaxID=869754 RepID=A0A1A0HC64_9ASCO|nr:Mis12-domain-containing protein [Metschnikowia bicuspidata var. bicuspidata NRRL YB-4993]OBA21724.1 Mis12-domain-containing protein [Metschnikowia bicuspidata var. bicuspidata NRRL YB-4993]
MNSSDYRVTALLTEHLGFAPLTLVDEVINAVNKIMYNCTDALENFLVKRREAQLKKLRMHNGIGEDDADIDTDGFMTDQIAAAERNGEVFPYAEIRSGTAELETLLVSHVDKNFDKFELYTLRNILTMPRDLVEDGWVRLKHHEHLDTVDFASVSEDSSARIKSLIRNISMELQLRKLLQFQLAKAKKLVSLLTRYKHSIDSLILTHLDTELSPDSARILKENLTPMNENIYYLLSQLNDLIEQALRLKQTFTKDTALKEGGQVQFWPTNREDYIREKTIKLLENITGTSPGSRPSAA